MMTGWVIILIGVYFALNYVFEIPLHIIVDRTIGDR